MRCESCGMGAVMDAQEGESADRPVQRVGLIRRSTISGIVASPLASRAEECPQNGSYTLFGTESPARE